MAFMFTCAFAARVPREFSCWNNARYCWQATGQRASIERHTQLPRREPYQISIHEARNKCPATHPTEGYFICDFHLLEFKL